MNFTKYLWDKLPYFRFNAHNDIAGTESGIVEETGTRTGCESTEASGEDGKSAGRLEIGEECKLKGVESVYIYTSPTPTSPRTGTTPAPAPHIAVASNTYYRTGELLTYNERTGSCTVIDSHGNLVTLQSAGNPFKR